MALRVGIIISSILAPSMRSARKSSTASCRIGRRSDRLRHLSGSVCLTIVIAGALLASGCARALSVLAYKTVGDTIQAKYVPPKEPSIVLAEDFQNPGNTSVESEQLARYVTQNLEKKSVAPLIDPNLAVDLRSRDPSAYRKMSITDIGKSLGAKQVLYIAISNDGLDSAMGTDYRRAEAAARVRWVNVDTGKTLWPE